MDDLKIEIFVRKEGDVNIGLLRKVKQRWHRKKYLEIKNDEFEPLDVIVHNTEGVE